MRYLSTAIIFFSLFISTQLLAALPTYNSPSEVAVPDVSGWTFGITGLYLQPSVTNGAWDYGSIRRNPSHNYPILSVDPGYDFSAGFNGNYIFPGTANDFNVDFLYINTDDNNSFTGAPNSLVIKPIPYHDPGNFDNASAKGELNFGQVDIGFGQYIGVGCRIILHPLAGIHLAQIDEKLNATYAALRDPSDNDRASMSTDSENEFRAYGLMAGLDSSFYLGRGFSLESRFTSAISRFEEDESKLDVSYVTNTFDNLGPKNVSVHSWIHARYAPSIDGRLGLDYTYLLSDNANSMITLEAGYRVLKYFQAIDRFAVVDVSTIQIPTIVSVERKTSDFALSGPYINLTYHHG